MKTSFYPDINVPVSEGGRYCLLLYVLAYILWFGRRFF